MTPVQVPTLGRVIHFHCDQAAANKITSLGGKRYAVGEKVPGIVTRVFDNNACSLTLFPDAEETMHVGQIPYSAGNQPGTWNWPERAGETQEAAA